MKKKKSTATRKPPKKYYCFYCLSPMYRAKNRFNHNSYMTHQTSEKGLLISPNHFPDEVIPEHFNVLDACESIQINTCYLHHYKGRHFLEENDEFETEVNNQVFNLLGIAAKSKKEISKLIDNLYQKIDDIQDLIYSIGMMSDHE